MMVLMRLMHLLLRWVLMAMMYMVPVVLQMWKQLLLLLPL
jgi:hypothetical protein